MKSLADTSEFASGIAALHLPRYDEIPSIDLYMDQLIELLESTLRPLHLPDEKIVTPSMVNNYVKQGILSAPRGKKYGRDNIARLIVIDVLKQAFSHQRYRPSHQAAGGEFFNARGLRLLLHLARRRLPCAVRLHARISPTP